MGFYLSMIKLVILFIIVVIIAYVFLSLITTDKDIEIINKDVKKIGKEIEYWEKIDNKYEEYMNFLISNNFENKYTTEDYEKELELCNKFLEKNPNFNDLILTRKISLLIELKKYDEALKNYKILVNKNPENSSVYILAECYAGLNNKEKAFELINQKYEKEKKDSTYYITVGKIYYILENYKEAIENYSTAIELEKSSPYGESTAFYLNRAKAYKAINDIEKYNLDMQKVEELKEYNRKKLAEIENKSK